MKKKILGIKTTYFLILKLKRKQRTKHTLEVREISCIISAIFENIKDLS